VLLNIGSQPPAMRNGKELGSLLEQTNMQLVQYVLVVRTIAMPTVLVPQQRLALVNKFIHRWQAIWTCQLGLVASCWMTVQYSFQFRYLLPIVAQPTPKNFNKTIQ
jgi:hypothetical protein